MKRTRHATLPAACILYLASGILSCVLPAADERSPLRDWANAAFFGQVREERAAAGIEVRRQDYGKFSFRRSVMDTPLQIGAKKYEHGAGTHSQSEIVVRLAEPARAFSADIGVDNNYDTKGKLGSVVFALEAGGKELFRSKLCRGGEEPVPVNVDLGGAREFILRVTDGGDGPQYDQSDWADASITFAEGKTMFLEDLPIARQQSVLGTATPFSFLYDAKPVAELLGGWKREVKDEPERDGVQRRTLILTDPATGLELTGEVRFFTKHPAVEWVLALRNTGDKPTPLIQNLLPLDVNLTTPAADVTLHASHGSTCKETDFLPGSRIVTVSNEVVLMPNGGRSSDGHLPFFNLEWSGGGLVGAIGWSGQWALMVRRSSPTQTNLRAGQQFGRFSLQPGERVRTPRMLLLWWEGQNLLRGQNAFRRLLLEHYVPRVDGQIAVPPVTENGWFTFSEGNKVTEQNQLEMIASMPANAEYYWLDAGWFEGGWPGGVGSWVPKADAFPRGLKPLSDAARARGMKFVVWFEPERVAPGSRIAKEHPEWVLHAGQGDGLFNLGDPAARQWLTDHLSTCISDWGINIYRNDFNIDPLRFWQAADKPGRQGLTEIRYIEGLYAMWDELLKRHPGLIIDNCASGGRRIDLEMISRSLPLWRSDTQCGGKPQPVWDQVQTAGLSLYVPLHAAGLWSFDPYVMRSAATTGMNLCMNTMAKDFPMQQAVRGIEEVKALRPCYLGDYYPLLPIDLNERHWCAWQFDRADTGEGFAVFFRRADSPYSAVDVQLRGLDAKATYEVSFFDTFDPKEKKTLRGEELAKLRVDIPAMPGSQLVRYRKR